MVLLDKVAMLSEHSVYRDFVHLFCFLYWNNHEEMKLQLHRSVMKVIETLFLTMGYLDQNAGYCILAILQALCSCRQYIFWGNTTELVLVQTISESF